MLDLLTTPVVAGTVLALLWLGEALVPMFGGCGVGGRARNLALGAINALASATLLAAITVSATEIARRQGIGLLHAVDASMATRAIVALVVLDLWHYVFHVLAHKVPVLWRLHQVHHHDEHVQATSAMRFHVFEVMIQCLCTVPVILVLGLDLWQLLLYEAVLLPVALFHHADVRISERVDRVLRTVIVTPRMHWVHHSSWTPETDSNFSSVFSWWDRLFGTYRRRRHPERIRFGLEGFEASDTRTLRGMLATPFCGRRSAYGTRPSDPDLDLDEASALSENEEPGATVRVRAAGKGTGATMGS